MEPLSVLGIVSYKIFPAQMGGQKCAAGFYEALAAHIKVTLAVAKENEPHGGNITIMPFLFNHWKGILNLIYFPKLSKLIKQQKVDVLIIEHSYFGWLGLLLRQFTGKPLVLRSHNIEAHRFRDMRRWWWRVYLAYERYVHRHADHSFFITPEDMAWALRHWKLDAVKCSVITCGVNIPPALSHESSLQYRQRLLLQYGLDANTRMFLFSGSFDYLPNTDALRIILNEIIPLLRAQQFNCRILICGSRLSAEWINELRLYPEIIYAGFVPDIDTYWYGADCFISPLTLGGGIRVKLVEALAHAMPCISTVCGARGIPTLLAGEKLKIVADYDWHSFVRYMKNASFSSYSPAPAAFLHEFNSGTIVAKALLSLQTL